MWLTLCVPIFLLFSFTLRQERATGVKRISKNLYTVSRTAVKNVPAAEQEEIRKVIAEHYGIKDFERKEIVIAANDPRNRKSGGIFETSVYKDWVSTRFIFWKTIRDLPQEVIKANEIMTRYATAGK